MVNIIKLVVLGGNMLLLDMSAIVVSATTAQFAQGTPLDEHMMRSIMLSQTLYYKKKFHAYGRPILCFDSHHYWRKDNFEFYKMNRKKARADSKFDWKEFHRLYDIVKAEFYEFVPYMSLEVDRCEADDIIAVLAKNSPKPVLIVSGDKDLLQLQVRRKDIKQWSTSVKKYINLKTNEYSLIEHIIRGDSSDGIPNILSDPDTFICDHKRQKAIQKTFIKDAESMRDPINICPNADAIDRWKRNLELIDLNKIPKEYVKAIKQSYVNKAKNPNKDRLRTYFIEKNLRMMYSKINEFRM
jgi:hypothetical protein